MSRLVRIIEGGGKAEARTFQLAGSKVMIGRSRTADFQIPDPTVSGRHLEITLDEEGVFVENVSDKGTDLNGKPLTAVMSLAHGDQLKLGSTKLRYEEIEGPARSEDPPSGAGGNSGSGHSGLGTAVARPTSPPAPAERDPDATHVFERPVPPPVENEGDSGHTRNFGGSEGTRMASEQELGPVLRGRPKPSAGKSALVWVFLLVLLAGSVAGFLWISRKTGTPEGEVSFTDALYGFSLRYPVAWSKLSTKPDLFEVGVPEEQDPGAPRVRIQVERGAEVESTGLTIGFADYVGSLPARRPGFELTSSRRLNLTELTVIYFEFGTSKLTGTGFFVPNGTTRYMIECTCPNATADLYQPVFKRVLESFSLLSATQEFIDFPASTETQRRMALSRPEELSVRIDELHRAAKQLFETRDVRPENLYRSIEAYRTALQYAFAGRPTLHASYQTLTAELRDATRLLNREIAGQLFELRRAARQGDFAATAWAAKRLMQTNPDRTHLAYREAEVELKNATRLSRGN